MISKVGWTEEDHMEYADYLRDRAKDERAEQAEERRQERVRLHWMAYERQKGW